jgi:hypothetical protein
MEHLTISNDWLPVDGWIADALDNSVPTSQIEADLVDCLLFWSAKHSRKGSSSRDSLAKSLEAVRILVSLGIDCHLASLRGEGNVPSRLRDFFKAPFTRLKTLDSRARIETLLGLEFGPEALSAYWKSESKEQIDNRLYAMVRKRYEDAVADAIHGKEIQSILKRLIKITAIPCQMNETRTSDTVGIHPLIRTILAMYLNQIKRPTRLRRVTESSADSLFKGFEPLTKAELKKIQGNASLTGSRKMEIDRRFFELIQQLDVSGNVMQEIFYGYSGFWTDYISRIWGDAQKSAEEESKRNEKKFESDPLGFFELNFIVDEAFQEDEIAKSEKDDEIIRVLINIFIEPGVEYSRKDLDLSRGAMPKKDLDSILRKAEKKGFVSSRTEAGKKLYVLKPPKSP